MAVKYRVLWIDSKIMFLPQVSLDGAPYEDFQHGSRGKPGYNTAQMHLVHSDVLDRYPDAVLDVDDPQNVAAYQPLPRLLQQERSNLVYLFNQLRQLPDPGRLTLTLHLDGSGRVTRHAASAPVEATLYAWESLDTCCDELYRVDWTKAMLKVSELDEEG